MVVERMLMVVFGILIRFGVGIGMVGIGDSKVDFVVGFVYGGNVKFWRGVDLVLMGVLIVCFLGWVDVELGGFVIIGRFCVVVVEEGFSYFGG